MSSVGTRRATAARRNWPTDAPSVADYTRKIGAFLDSLGIREAHMVSHSFGGTLMPAFRGHIPRVLSMVAAQPVVDSGPLGPARQAEIVAAREKMLAEMSIEDYARDHAPMSVASTAEAATVAKGIEVSLWTRPKGYLAQWRAMARADIFSEIGENLPTTTVVTGMGDKTASTDIVRRIATALEGAELVELPDIGHMIYIEHPERFNAALEGHLARAG